MLLVVHFELNSETCFVYQVQQNQEILPELHYTGMTLGHYIGYTSIEMKFIFNRIFCTDSVFHL